MFGEIWDGLEVSRGSEQGGEMEPFCRPNKGGFQELGFAGSLFVMPVKHLQGTERGSVEHKPCLREWHMKPD